MGFSVEGTTIRLIRGDTFAQELSFSLGETPYEPQDGDVAVFTMRKNFKGKSNDKVIIQKVIDMTDEEPTLFLEPSDTSDLKYGTYKYDIEITYSEGIVDTAKKGDFIIEEEVT